MSKLKHYNSETKQWESVGVSVNATPDALPNPNALTIGSVSYDGSVPVDMTEIINALVDARLQMLTQQA